MRIEVVLIGDELLTGELDPYPERIVQAIRQRGASIARITVLRDDREEIVSELKSVTARGTDMLLVTGGLGPTIDDVTRHALAMFLAKDLVLNEEARSWMEEALVARHGRPPKPSSTATLMAMVPEGTEALRNPVGVACGIRATMGPTTMVFVPGFPNEMLAMFESYFLPSIRPEDVHEAVLRVRRRETTMEPLFQQVAREHGVRIASLPKEDWRSQGNVVVIKGRKGAVEAAARQFLELVEGSKDEYEDQ